MNPAEHKPELPAEVRKAIENELRDLSFTRTLRMFAILAPLWPKPAPSAPDVQDVAEGIARVAEDYLEDSLGVGYLVNVDGQKAIAAILTRFAVELTAQKDAEIARLNKACDAFSNAEILSGDWKARAEKAEAELARLKRENESLRTLWTEARDVVTQGRNANCLMSYGKTQCDAVATANAWLDKMPTSEKRTIDDASNAEWHLQRVMAERDQLRDQLAATQEALAKARSVAYAAPELNTSNYDHEQVCQLNAAMCEVFTLLDAARAKEDRSHD